MNVPFLDLRQQHQQLRQEMLESLGRVLDQGTFCLGPEVAAFEQEIARAQGCSFGIGVNSGTSALQLALLAAGVKPGDEVITSSLSFVATAAAILYCGARPVYADVLADFYTLDPESVRQRISPKTRAIVPVHLYGQMCRMEKILEIAQEHNLAIVEDAAQAHLATRNGALSGTFGVASGLSFYPSKNLGACGEAGLVLTSNEKAHQEIRQLRDWGQVQKYHHEKQGFNFRMDAFQAAILRVKLPHLKEWTLARQRCANLYQEMLEGLEIRLPQVDVGNQHVYHLYPVLLENRDAVRQRMEELGIGCGCHYPIPIHLQPPYSDPEFPKGSLPETERVAASVLTLPMYPELSSDQQQQVVEALAQALQERET